MGCARQSWVVQGWAHCHWARCPPLPQAASFQPSPCCRSRWALRWQRVRRRDPWSWTACATRLEMQQGPHNVVFAAEVSQPGSAICPVFACFSYMLSSLRQKISSWKPAKCQLPGSSNKAEGFLPSVLPRDLRSCHDTVTMCTDDSTFPHHNIPIPQTNATFSCWNFESIPEPRTLMCATGLHAQC